MLNFHIDSKSCTKCGLCAADCPAQIITLESGTPQIPADKEEHCYQCQHCLAVCPVGAVSIFGKHAADSVSTHNAFPAPEQLAALIKGRRSVRKYKDEDLPSDLIQRMLEVVCHAPTGVNSRQVRFTLIDKKEVLHQFRDEVMAGLSRLAKTGALPKGMEFFAEFVRLWEEHKVDSVFRGAPHLLIATAPKTVASPVPDCLIALTTFDLFAQANGIGTVWDGIFKWTLEDLLPELKKKLGIPEDHVFGYSMVFGKPAVRFPRSVQRGPANIHRVSGLS